MQRNVLGSALRVCCRSPLTGFYRNGLCETDEEDHGKHTVCAVLTDDFLKFSMHQGNDLMTPRPEAHFPGLKAGDKWCLCALRWWEAYEHDVAPYVILEATQEETLNFIPFQVLKEYSAPAEGQED